MAVKLAWMHGLCYGALSLGLACSRPPSNPPAHLAKPDLAALSRPWLSAKALAKEATYLASKRFLGRGSLAKEGKAASDYLAEQFRKLNYQVTLQPVLENADNVIAIKPGNDTAIIVAAHYDHLGVDVRGVWYPGADDNASGVALLLGLARTLRDIPTQSTIIFIGFAAEELGLVGSGVYARNPIWPFAQTSMLINFDMVGRDFLEWAGGRKNAVAVMGLEAKPELSLQAENFARQHNLSLVKVPARLIELFNFHDRTDDWWLRRQGVFCLHFTTTLHHDYHRPTDTAQKLKPTSMQAIANLVLDLILYMGK